MNRARYVPVLAMSLLLVSTGAALADVKSEEKSLVKFEGMLGRMMGLFGGKAAKEGIVTTVAVKGDRKATSSELGGQIIDLTEEKIYELDMRRKTYKVTTFAELRRQMEEARKKAEESAREQEPTPARQEGQPEAEIDFSLKESGQRKVINGFDCREVVMTVTTREKGKTLEQGGGIVLTANTWLGPRADAMKEIADFDRRYAEKLQGPFAAGIGAEQMAAMLAMYPGVQQAMARFRTENVSLEGTPIYTVMTVEAVKSQEQLAAEQKQEQEEASQPRGVGGLLGGLGKRMAKKGEAEPKTRAIVMTTTHEVLKISSDVAATDVALPAGFKER